MCLAGFGDNSNMYTPLLSSKLSGVVNIVPADLPGFGTSALKDRPTTLENLADVVARDALASGATIILAHSLSSIIASLAAAKCNNQIRMIVSLEGNLTRDDAYFSATAASYKSARAFRQEFLARLSRLADTHPMYGRYRKSVSLADENALWELGCDTYRFGLKHIPGEVLIRSAKVSYLFSKGNLSTSSLLWLAEQDIPRIELPGATHWVSLFQPHLLADAIIGVLSFSENQNRSIGPER